MFEWIWYDLLLYPAAWTTGLLAASILILWVGLSNETNESGDNDGVDSTR